MKFRITFKDPDVVSDAISEAIDEELEQSGLPEDERLMLRDHRIEKLQDKVTKWFHYMEYVTIEVDTDKNTAIVIPNEDYV